MNNAFQDNFTLIKHLKNGDKKAYTYLVDCFNHRLCVYAKGLTKNCAMAEDIVQNVFIKVWERRDSLKEDFSIMSFLYKSVYNEFIDLYRKKQSRMLLGKKYLETLNKLTEEKERDPTQRLIESVRVAIQSLPPKCKQTFLLSKKEGLTNIEIAEHLNISIKSVEGHITKAFKIIRNKVGVNIEITLLLIFQNSMDKN